MHLLGAARLSSKTEADQQVVAIAGGATSTSSAASSAAWRLPAGGFGSGLTGRSNAGQERARSCAASRRPSRRRGGGH